jgi:hypothetical protein
VTGVFGHGGAMLGRGPGRGRLDDGIPLTGYPHIDVLAAQSMFDDAGTRAGGIRDVGEQVAARPPGQQCRLGDLSVSQVCEHVIQLLVCCRDGSEGWGHAA